MNAISLLESGEFSDVNVYFDNGIYHLHKFPLLLKMGYVKDKVGTSSDVEMPYLDGGSELFTDIIAFCYGKDIEINPRNIAFLSNAAHVLDMFGNRNLIDLTDEYVDILITDMRMSHKFGPAIVALAYSASLKNYEYCDIFNRFLDAILSMWVRRSQHNDERLTIDPVLTEFLVFLPDNVVIRIIQEISTMKSTFCAIAELAAKFFALRFALEVSYTEANDERGGPCVEENGRQDNKVDLISTNHLKRAAICTCLPFERINSLDRDMLTEELGGIRYDLIPLEEIMDSVFTALPKDVPLVSKINVDWCKQALSVTERRRDSSTSRPLILEIAGKMMARFSVQELRIISPQTIKDILATMNLRANQSASTSGDGTSSGLATLAGEERKGEVNSAIGGPLLLGEEPSTIAENLDLYLSAAIESQNMTIEEYIGLLKTALPLDRRENHDGLIRAICKLVKSNNEALTDNLREEILGVLDLRRCSAAALQDALDANILPTRAVAEAALRFAKQNSTTSANAVAVRERCQSPSPSRFSSSTSSIYRASRYMLPYQHYAASAYYPISSSTSTGYLLTSPVRQRRRPWERPIHGYDDALPPIYRHHDIGGDYVVAKGENEDVQWNSSKHATTAYRSGDY
ncbi:putative BTB/POZ domain-containing protein [Echinococcus granulosus]|uniref:BTB:POZ domain containing protein n=1 Tax=Echinococcus granulosus TaxID=6210 RepID=A0A068WTM4_ECHGR|nr:putative BTB/POZ domain-containing protein [Echinococcus granulosus]CDS23522.1 BTB:POZ domain containing protein [Echinococcus granulosus]